MQICGFLMVIVKNVVNVFCTNQSWVAVGNMIQANCSGFGSGDSPNVSILQVLKESVRLYPNEYAAKVHVVKCGITAVMLAIKK